MASSASNVSPVWVVNNNDGPTTNIIPSMYTSLVSSREVTYRITSIVLVYAAELIACDAMMAGLRRQ